MKVYFYYTFLYLEIALNWILVSQEPGQLVVNLPSSTADLLWIQSSPTFPPDAGIINVKEAPYLAKGNGIDDDTMAIQQAINDYPSKNKIIYLPPGTYLVSKTIRWSQTSSGNAQKRIILQGAGAKQTIIRLKDQTFTQPVSSKDKYHRPLGVPILWTGVEPAQRFRNAIRDLTISIGKKNPYATGIQFIANNQGTVQNVIIQSEDDGGIVGLDLGYTDEQGPCLIKNVWIQGFQIGIFTWGAVNSITFSNIFLENQKKAGILNDHQVLSIENLFSKNSVPTLINAKKDGVVTIISGHFSFPKNSPLTSVSNEAIINEGFLYGRNLACLGYSRILASQTSSSHFYPELLSHPIKGFHPETTSPKNRLEIYPTPTCPLFPLEEWCNPSSFGAQPNDDQDDTQAIQQAIDSGKKVVYLPNGKWKISGEIFLRGSLQLLIGCEAMLDGDGLLRVIEGEAPWVRIERLEIAETRTSNLSIFHETKRPLILAHCRWGRNGCYEGKGGGDLYVEDVAGDPWILRNQKAWFRQVNPESSYHPKIQAENSHIWILGLKTEGDMPALIASRSTIEICGAFIYANTSRPKYPLFIIDEYSQLTFTMGESSFRKEPFRCLVLQLSEVVTQQWKELLNHYDIKKPQESTFPPTTKFFWNESAYRRGEGSAIPLWTNQQ